MLNVIVMSSDTAFCRLVGTLIQQEAPEMTLSGLAGSGPEALDLAARCRPDILITDICLTDSGGLELIRKARELFPHLEVILISGCAHFEDVQSIIRLGVSDYLLKPVRQHLLIDALHRAGERCRNSRRMTAEAEELRQNTHRMAGEIKRLRQSNRQMTREIEELRQSNREDQKRLQNHLLQDLLSGLLGEADSESLWEDYHFRQETECVQLLFLQFDYDESRLSQEATQAAKEKVIHLCTDMLGKICTILSSHPEENTCAILLGLKSEAQNQCRQVLRRCLNRIQTLTGHDGSAECTIALSPPVSSIPALSETCDRTRSLLLERLTCGTGQILEHLPPLIPWSTEKLLKPYRKILTDLPQLQTTAVIEQAIDLLEQEVSSLQGIRGEMIYDLVRSAGQLFLQQPPIPAGREKLACFSSRMAHIGHVPELFEALKTMVVHETEELIARQLTTKTRPIRLAQDYVLRHYSQPLTMEKVGEEVGFSGSYFSYLFKKETGENFLHFLSRVRMDRAKELLCQTDLSISQISEQIGYGDPNYFTKMFKQQTSLCPRQYRKLYS